MVRRLAESLEEHTMRASIYAEQDYRTGAPPQPGLEAVHIAPNVWAMVPPPWFPRAAFRSMDPDARTFEDYFRPAAPRPSRSYSPGPMMPPRSIYLMAVER